MSGTRPRRDRWARRGLLVPVLSAAALLCACTPTPNTGSNAGSAIADAPDNAVSQFASAWQAAQPALIGDQTSDPDAATEQIKTVLAEVKPTRIAVTTSGVTEPSAGHAQVTAHLVWTIPGGISWAYDTTWPLSQNKDGSWTVTWSPTVINPKLGAQQSIEVDRSSTTGGTIVDRNNVQLVTPTTIYSVVALPGKVADVAGTAEKLQALLEQFDPTVTATSVADGLAKATATAGYTVTNLRAAEYKKVQAQLTAIPGLVFPSQVKDLPPTKDFAKVLLSEVTPVAAKLETGTAGWKIVSIDSTGAELDTLAEHAADAGSNVTLTLDSKLQTSAEKLLAAIKEPAVLVAIAPSTGEILTVAQNQAANAQGPIALTGEYPPGSTFKIVTATAAFSSGLVTPASTVNCPRAVIINGQEIHNEGFELGNVPVIQAFARSCNTTFAKLSTLMPGEALPNAGDQYGVGLDFVIPGLTVLNGKIPVAGTIDQKAENGFGQGNVLVTPFAEAMMAATAANGAMPMPTIIRGTTTTVDQTPPVRSATVQSDIKQLMRAVVTNGTAYTFQDAGTVYAKTGTADYVNDKGKEQAHAWTTGFRGDVAFAALIVGGNDSKRTNILLDAWLKTFPAT